MLPLRSISKYYRRNPLLAVSESAKNLAYLYTIMSYNTISLNCAKTLKPFNLPH